MSAHLTFEKLPKINNCRNCRGEGVIRWYPQVKIADTLCNLRASKRSMEMRRIDKYKEQLNLLMGGALSEV